MLEAPNGHKRTPYEEMKDFQHLLNEGVRQRRRTSYLTQSGARRSSLCARSAGSGGKAGLGLAIRMPRPPTFGGIEHGNGP
jgi:hypothetical protein